MTRAVIAIFGANSVQRGTDEWENAWTLGKGLAKAGFSVMTGGYGGTMEAASEGARGAGGHVIGVTVEPWGPPNEFVTECLPHDGLLPRLEDLVNRGDGYVVLPGGTGTLLEIALVLEYQFNGSMPPRPLWFLGASWSPVVKAALAGQVPREWMGGRMRLPEYEFFNTPAEIVAKAMARFS